MKKWPFTVYIDVNTEDDVDPDSLTKEDIYDILHNIRKADIVDFELEPEILEIASRMEQIANRL